MKKSTIYFFIAQIAFRSFDVSGFRDFSCARRRAWTTSVENRSWPVCQIFFSSWRALLRGQPAGRLFPSTVPAAMHRRWEYDPGTYSSGLEVNYIGVARVSLDFARRVGGRVSWCRRHGASCGVGDGGALPRWWWEYRKGQSTVHHYIPSAKSWHTGASERVHSDDDDDDEDDIRTLNGRNLSGRQVHWQSVELVTRVNSVRNRDS